MPVSTMSVKAVPIGELRVGMYVIIPLPWYEHPFIQNQFLITSEKEIKKLQGLDLQHLEVDLAQSRFPDSLDVPLTEAEVRAHEMRAYPPSQPFVPHELLPAIHDNKMPPETKAGLIQQHSVVMMKNLFKKPSSENIRELKKIISEIVDLILRDDETTFWLINITSHDYDTYIHSVSVGVLSVALAKVIFRHTDSHDLHALGSGFFLHDLGKVKIDPEIINKTGKLTAGEMEEMKRHPAIGFSMLQETNQLTKESGLIVLQHHEKVDGTGYPAGLVDNDIHIYGRLCSIADIFDALTSQRPYKQRLSAFAALKLMKNQMVPHHVQKDIFEKFVLLFESQKVGQR